jgi:alpha-tubulin suppressor-like RCC1 family protein
VTVTGDVYTWGSNDYGQLGITLTTPSSGTPIAQSSGSIVRNVVAGRDFSLIVYADGTAKAFGRNDVGQLGINSISPNEPVSTNVYTAGALAGFSILDAGAGPDFAFLIASPYLSFYTALSKSVNDL